MAFTDVLIPLAAGTVLFGLVVHLTPPAVAWLALPLLLHASRSMPRGVAGVAMWFAIWVALAVGNRGAMPFGGVAYFLANAFLAATVTVAFVLDRFLAPRLGAVASMLVFPMALVMIEFLRSRYAPPATWFSLGYSQYGVLPLMQIASVTGIWGITFLLGWFASTFQFAWAHQFDGSARIAVIACAAVIAVVMVAGSLRVALAQPDRPALRAAALNRPVDLFIPGEMTRIATGRVSSQERPYFSAKLATLHDWFLESSRREARAGARLIAWPEQNLLVFAEDERAFVARAAALAAEEHVYLAMGLGVVHLGAPLPFENKLVLIDPSGRTLVSYLKSHPVSGWEASVMRVGDGRVPIVDTPDGRMAGAICFDADFPEFIRQAGARDVGLLIVPANEWKAIKEIHAQMAAFRAIENGLTLVRPAASGLSTAVDPWGRVLGMADYFAGGDRTMTAQVSAAHVSTLYAKMGDLFAWLCVAGVLAVAVAARWG